MSVRLTPRAREYLKKEVDKEKRKRVKRMSRLERPYYPPRKR